MKIIRPVTVTDASLVSSSVAETEPLYNPATTYGVGDVVRDAAHQRYESQQAANTGHALDDLAWWINTGPTNRWAMFDQVVGTETTAAADIATVVQVTGRADSVALLNVAGSSVEIVAETVASGEVYRETFDLNNTSVVTDWWAYFFEEVERSQTLIVQNLPIDYSPKITVTVATAGGAASVGTQVIGLSKQIGASVYGAQVGIKDYSRKEADDFGNAIVVERAFAKRGNFTVWCERAAVDAIGALLSQYRATPLVWVASESYTITAIYGFYKDWNLEIAYPTHSICSLEIEGLT